MNFQILAQLIWTQKNQTYTVQGMEWCDNKDKTYCLCNAGD